MKTTFEENVEQIGAMLKKVLGDQRVEVCVIDECISSIIFLVRIEDYEYRSTIHQTEELDSAGLKRRSIGILVNYASFQISRPTQGATQ